MSASDNCFIFTCFQNCCNIDGVCPTSTGTFSQQNCVYYYDNDYYGFWLWYTWWIWVIIGVGSLLFIACIVCCVVACVRSSRAKNQDVIVVNTDQYNQGYNNGQYNNGQYNNGQYNNGQYNNNPNQAYEMGTINQPRPSNMATGRPLYPNNQNAPLSSNTDNIYL